MKKSVWVFLIILIAVTSITYLLKPIADPDFFWHLATGEWIAQHKSLPSADPFSYTVPGTSTRAYFILTQYWLSQVLYYGFYSFLGWNGIVLVRFAILAGLLYFIFRRRGEADITAFFFFMLIAIVVLLRSFPLERPQVFSFMFFAILLHLLDKLKSPMPPHGKRLSGHDIFALPLLMLVWANMHGGHILGQVIIALYLVSEGIKLLHPIFGTTIGKERYKRFAAIGVVSILASFINPNGYKGLILYLEFKEGVSTGELLLENESTVTNFLSTSNMQIPLYWALLAICVIIVSVSIFRKRQDITEIAMLTGLGFVSFTTLRFVPFFLIYAVPLASSAFKANNREMLKGTIAAALSLTVAVYFLAWQGDMSNFKNLSNFRTSRWVATTFPEAATEFIKQENLKGRMYNNYDWGGYLVWKLAPERKVFGDNRTLDKEIFFLQLMIQSAIVEPEIMGKPYYKALLDTYTVNYIITKVYDTRVQMIPLVPKLILDPEWIPVFEESNAIIFVKDMPANKHIIKKHSYVRDTLIDRQIAALDRTIKKAPGHVSLYILRGDLHLLKESPQGARLSYLKALELFPGNAEASKKLQELKADKGWQD